MHFFTLQGVEFAQACDRFLAVVVFPNGGRLPIPNRVYSENIWSGESLPKLERTWYDFGTLAPLLTENDR